MTTADKVIKNKLGLINLAEQLGNVSQACKIMGYSRDSFYRFKELYDEQGEEGLRELSRRRPNPKNRVDPLVEDAVLAIAIENPALGQLRVSNTLKKEGIFVSPGGVRSIWLRHDLETFKKRLKVLEEKAAAENLVLTETQLQAMEKAKEQREAHGEIETEHPGYLGAQDTYYVGTIKGIGRIYQQTFIDTYSKTGFTKLYTSKHAITAADLLNDRVLPWYEEQEVRLLRILTDRGTEYNGSIENHEYQLYLAIEDIDHSKTKTRHPQTNGICERFHRTIKEEFYEIAFRKKIYSSLEELQADLDQWMAYYNAERPHSGKYCDGRTPDQTFSDTRHLANEKMIDARFPKEVSRQDSNSFVSVA
jgi:transposase InsO family protein